MSHRLRKRVDDVTSTTFGGAGLGLGYGLGKRLAARWAATRRGGAVAGEPALNGGFGAYSMPSWIAWAVSSSVRRAARARAMSMPAETPAEVAYLPSKT